MGQPSQHPHRATTELPPALRSIIGWLTGHQPEVSKSEKQLEARLVDLLVEELAGETSLTVNADDGARDESQAAHRAEAAEAI